MRSLVFSCFMFACLHNLVSQDLTTDSNRAARFYRSGLEQFDLLNYHDALSFFERAISVDGDFVEAFLLAGDVSIEIKEYHQAAGFYKKAISIDPGFYPGVYINLGDALMAVGEYEKACYSYRGLNEIPNATSRQRAMAAERVDKCEFALNAVNNPVPFDPISLGPSVNSCDDEYWPALTADEKVLVFTRQKKRDPRGERVSGNLREDFYISYKTSDGWSVAESIGPPLVSDLNEGASSLSVDGRKIFFTACNRDDGYGSCDIYFASRLGDEWGKPVNAGPPLNSRAWEAQPSISADGRTLYFSSNRPGGVGGMDIWYSTLNDNGSWGSPVNMGERINTAGNEMSPFIHPDNRTLYFSSDGHPGMGGYDLFVTRIDESGEWSDPENLGYPLNTHFDEIGLIVNARGDKGYFASDRMSGEVRDIYMFDLYSEIRPVEVSYMKGTVYDAVTYERLDASFELIELESSRVVYSSVSDPENGEFLVPVVTGRDYALNVSRKGYLFHSEHFSLSGFAHQTDPYLRDILLRRVMEGEVSVLRNIFFEFDSYRLKPESIAELDRFVQFLEDNPAVNIQINGHTDNIGQPDYNISLSLERARSVALYLIDSGVDNERISYRGFGETMPVDDNNTEEGRAANRRTEFKITGVDFNR